MLKSDRCTSNKTRLLGAIFTLLAYRRVLEHDIAP